MKLLGDVIIVTHLKEKVSTSIHLPDDITYTHVGLVPAIVEYVGSKFRHKEHIKPFDKVLVPFHLGNRLKKLSFTTNSKMVVYDGEDVYALLS